jgi:hypothetical protein
VNIFLFQKTKLFTFKIGLGIQDPVHKYVESMNNDCYVHIYLGCWGRFLIQNSVQEVAKPKLGRLRKN